MNWYIVKKVDSRARALADRHYSRQTPGAREFCAPGNSIVLIIPSSAAAKALWVSHRPDPRATLDQRRADGLDYYDNAIFRNESGIRSSDLIREAISITRFLWSDYNPPDGFHTFIDPRHVRPIWRRGQRHYGYTYELCGFKFAGTTKTRKLLRFQLRLADYLNYEPQMPLSEQLTLDSWLEEAEQSAASVS